MRRSVLVDRGSEEMILYPSVLKTDSRGNKARSPDFTSPYSVMVNYSTDRQATAELPGQIDVKVVKLIAPYKTPIESWARVKFRGEYWDIATPPVISRFTKATRHVEFTLRSRNELAT